jgi:hypothetical protein
MCDCTLYACFAVLTNDTLRRVSGFIQNNFCQNPARVTWRVPVVLYTHILRHSPFCIGLHYWLFLYSFLMDVLLCITYVMKCVIRIISSCCWYKLLTCRCCIFKMLHNLEKARRPMAQTVTCRAVASVASVRARAGSFAISDAETDPGACSSQYFCFPCQYPSTNAPYSYYDHGRCYIILWFDSVFKWNICLCRS